VLHFRQRYFGSTLKLYEQALKVAQDRLRADPRNQRLLHQEAEIHNLLGNLYFKLWNLGACRREFAGVLAASAIVCVADAWLLSVFFASAAVESGPDGDVGGAV
jgi:predicted dinucleotide-utilizing enzyme